METITREELQHFVGKQIFLIVNNDFLLRDQNNAFFAAVNEQEAAAFCEAYKNEFPADDYNFSVYPYDVPNVAAFNLLFDNNYSGFQIVNLGFYVKSDELFEKRQNVISKLIGIYRNGKCLYVPLDAEMKAIAHPVDDVPVTISFYSDEEKAKTIGENGSGAHTIERWINNLPLDTTLFSVDDEVVYGWEICEAIQTVWSDYIVTPDFLKTIVKDNCVHVLAAGGLEQALTCDGIPILFASRASMEEFQKTRSELAEQGYEETVVEKKEELRLIIGNGKYAFVDNEEGRFVARTNELLDIFE